MAIVGELSVVEISLEDDQVGLGEVLEEIWSFRVEVPLMSARSTGLTYEGITGTPEGVSLVLPLALLFILLPSVTQRSERVHLLVRGFGEELTVHTRVEDPVPVELGDIGNEPGDLLSVENDLGTDARLDEPVGIDHVAVELETGIVKDKVDSTALDGQDVVGQLVKVVSENVLLRRGEMVSSGRLKLFDVFLGHVDEKGQIGRVTPKTD